MSEHGDPSGAVQSVTGKSAVVEIGGKRITVGIDRLYKIQRSTEPVPEQRGDVNVSFEPMESTTLDVRGETRDSALERVDLFLDRAVLNGVQEVKVIHGIGGGVLIESIRQNLKTDPRVRSLRPGQAIEGGAGVSFVTLK